MLTKKQKEVLDFIHGYTNKNLYAPSLEEIRKHFSLASVSTAHHYVKKLQEEGFIQKEENQPRGMSILPGDFMGSPVMGNIIGFDYISIPLVGSANCGPALLLAEENIEGYLSIPKKMVKKKSGIFALRAVGKSLNRANIQGQNIEEGDYVLIDTEDRSIKDGDYVLSIIDGSANLKKYSFDKKLEQICLLSESTEMMKPIYILAGDNFVINGKVVGVIKKQKQATRKK